MELGRARFYTTQGVNETTGFKPDNYGNIWYSVKFLESAETILWKAKSRPEEGKQVYGVINKTESGKAYRFKSAIIPDGVKPETAETPFSGAAPEGWVKSTFQAQPDSTILDEPNWSPTKGDWNELMELVQEIKDKLIVEGE